MVGAASILLLMAFVSSTWSGQRKISETTKGRNPSDHCTFKNIVYSYIFTPPGDILHLNTNENNSIFHIVVDKIFTQSDQIYIRMKNAKF